MTFTENWFGDLSQDALAGYAAETGHLHGRVVEVGCWEGRSTVALATAVRPHTVHAVDTWEGSPGEVSWDLAHTEGRDVYGTFLDNVKDLGNVEPHRMTWQDYFAADTSPVKFCHIDAEHTYEQVKGNILAVLPLLVPGGYLVGDDAHHPPVVEAVSELLPGWWRDATLWIWRKD